MKPLDLLDAERVVSEEMRRRKELISQSVSDLVIREEARPANVVLDRDLSIQVVGGGGLYTYGGRLHMVPENFCFPTCCVESSWSNWFFGHLSDLIRSKSIEATSACQIKASLVKLTVYVK